MNDSDMVSVERRVLAWLLYVAAGDDEYTDSERKQLEILGDEVSEGRRSTLHDRDWTDGHEERFRLGRGEAGE